MAVSYSLSNFVYINNTYLNLKTMKKKILFLMLASTVVIAPSCKKKGCMDPLANNYSEKAEKDNGSCDYSATEVTEDITVNTTWTANKTYLINTTINVENNATLTIEPGTVIKFGEEGELDVSYSGDFGTIKAIGTADRPILFTSNSDVKTAGDWDGIWLYQGANSCEFTYCTFEYGGGYSDYSGALNLKGGNNLTVEHSIFNYNQYFGVYYSSGSFASFTNNILSNSGLNDLRLTASEVEHLGTGNSFSTDIFVYGNYVERPGDVRWLNQGVALSLDGDIDVGSSTGTKLIIDAGCVIKFGSNDELGVGSNGTGLIEAIGTATQPIVFTSKSSYPAKGDWDGIWFYSNSTNGSILDYCTVEYASGYSSSPAGIVYKYGQGSKVTVSNSILRHSAGYGMMLDQSSDTSYPTLSNNTYTDNDLGDKNW